MAQGKLDKRIDELRVEIEVRSQIEREALARVNGEDESWNREQERTIEKMFDLVVSYKPEDPAHKAVHLLGQLVAEVEKIRAPKRIVQELDNYRKLLHNLQDQRRAYEETQKERQRVFEEHKLAVGD